MGTMTCQNGQFGACSSDRMVTRAKTGPLRLLGLQATPAACVGNLCDPYCQNYLDTPQGVDAGDGFTTVDGGLTLVLAPLPVQCTGLVVTPSTTTVTVTGLSPVTTSGSVTYTAALTPSNCYSKGYKVLWGVDHGERADMVSTSDTTAVLSVVSAVTGPLTIYAYTGGLSAVVTANVVVRIRDSSALPAQATNYWNTDGTAKTPTSGLTSKVVWLYPYDNTLLPLGLAAPVLQWQRATGASAATSMKVTLRYPASGTTTFEYSRVIAEPNPLRITIPALAWQGLEQTAQNSTAVISLQRYVSGTLEPESVRNVKLANGKLKGTVYYNSYNTKLMSSAGEQTGGVLAIQPGAATPTLAIPSKTTCHVCHSLPADGSRLFFQNADFDSSSVYQVSNRNLLYSYNNTSSPEYGNRFDWGAIYPDGSFVFTHSSTTTPPEGYHVFGNYSGLYPVAYTSSPSNTSSTANPLSLSGKPSDLQGVTPAFSPDGRKLAFNFWAGTSTGGISARSGTSLVVTDFSCGAATGSITCSSNPPTSSSMSNWRQLIRVNTGSYTSYKYVGWPSFLPDANGIVYQMVARAPASVSGGTGSNLYTWQGALSELWLTNIPSSSSTAATPIRLANLNGTGYIPGSSPGPSPAPTGLTYHTTGSTVYWATSGTNKSPTAYSGTVTEDQLNYMPTVAPQEAGGYYWVVFTSRRLYGNVAVNTPWEYEELPAVITTPPAKKLWMAAIKKDWTTSSDPSYPAFYLPGQEELAGNMRGFWVKSPCITPGTTGSAGLCDLDEDCCGGTATPRTAACRIDPGSSPTTRHCQAVVPNSCAAIGAGCSTAADCCSPTAVCLDGLCAQPLQYGTTQSFTRDYVAVCPRSTRVVWRILQWKASETSNDHIDFYVQSFDPPATPPTALKVATAQAPSNPNSWNFVDVAPLMQAAVMDFAGTLRLTMTFVSSSDSAYAPVLWAWQMNYDCMESQ
jgi:hypothetical protein